MGSSNPSPEYLAKNIFIRKDTCTPVFTAVLSTVARRWRQPKCLSMEDWTKKMWYIHTMKYYSAIRKAEILPYVTTWMDIENIKLCKKSKIGNVKNHVVSLIVGYETETHRERQRCGGYQRKGGEGVEVQFKGGQLFGSRKWSDFGWWAHNALYRSHIIEMYAWTCMIWFTKCHPNKFNK